VRSENTPVRTLKSPSACEVGETSPSLACDLAPQFKGIESLSAQLEAVRLSGFAAIVYLRTLLKWSWNYRMKSASCEVTTSLSKQKLRALLVRLYPVCWSLCPDVTWRHLFLKTSQLRATRMYYPQAVRKGRAQPPDSLPNAAANLPKKSRPPMIGVRSSSSLSVVPRRAKTKSLFVSRISPEVTTADIERSLNEQLKLKSLLHPAKTTFNSYASVHISVVEDDFHLINNTGAWPSGCLIMTKFTLPLHLIHLARLPLLQGPRQ